MRTCLRKTEEKLTDFFQVEAEAQMDSVLTDALADKTEECEQMKKKYEELAEMIQKCMIKKTGGFEQSVQIEEVLDAQRMQLESELAICRSERVEDLVKFKIQNEQHKKFMVKLLEQAEVDKKKIQELQDKVNDLELKQSIGERIEVKHRIPRK